ncbi:MAG: hypothetical protein IK078_02615 [Lachnospiraceae bacterium]|nr:hypothetical protein [Lachnospiraceae bacterium]
MWIIQTFVPIILVLSVLAFLVMLPVYFVRRKKNPDDPKITIPRLLLMTVMAATIMTLIMCSGLIAMYIDDIRG